MISMDEGRGDYEGDQDEMMDKLACASMKLNSPYVRQIA